jgi:hypothetical protein
MNKGFLNGVIALLLSTLACRPVIAIGWQEFLIFFVLLTLELGPPLYRFVQRIENFRRRQKKDK